MDNIDPRKGGKGRVAPYDTTHVRIPTDIKSVVDCLSNEYKSRLFNEGSGGADRFLKALNQACDEVVSPLLLRPTDLPELNNMVEIAQSILSSKKSAKVSLEKLLTALYQQPVKLK